MSFALAALRIPARGRCGHRVALPSPPIPSPPFLSSYGPRDAWQVSLELGADWYFFIADHQTNSPTDVSEWHCHDTDVSNDVYQANVHTEAVSGGAGGYPTECYVRTADPTSSPVPTVTLSPTNARRPVATDPEIRATGEHLVGAL